MIATRIAALCLALAAALPVSAQGAPEDRASFGATDAPVTLLLRGALDIDTFRPVMQAFVAAAPDVQVVLEQWNTLDLHIVSRDDCLSGRRGADLVMSSAVDLQVKLVNMGCAQPYQSDATLALPPERNWRDELFGVTQEPAVIVYNRTLLPPELRPQSRIDLLDILRRPGTPFSGGRIATYDIEASGVGYLFAFYDSRQASTFGSLIEAFGRLNAVATCCSAEIIDGVRRGDYLLAYNVLGSYALEKAARFPELEVLAPADYTLMLSRAAFVPRASPSTATAGRLIDFLLSPAGRSVLEASNLLVGIGSDERISYPEQSVASLRPIPLSPVLLLGLDQQVRERFLATWRTAFDIGQTE